jgi:hypothetical protein
MIVWTCFSGTTSIGNPVKGENSASNVFGVYVNCYCNGNYVAKLIP